MNHFILLILTPLIVSSTRDNEINNKLINKHWAGSCNNSTCDTITFSSFKKTNLEFYKWGSGYSEGFEFSKDGSVKTFHTVFCSDESNPIDAHPSKWIRKGKDSLIIESGTMTINYRVLSLNNKTLQLLTLGYKMKNK